jgi:pyruvyltransferase
MKKLRVFWMVGPPPGNVGDQVTPWLLRAAGVPFRRAPKKFGGKILMCGSLVSTCTQDGDTLWGTGNVSNDLTRFLKGRTVHALAVRGPLTRDRLQTAGVPCPEIYGDPALLLPRFYNPKVEKTHALGIVPHHWDFRNEVYPKDKGARIISPLRRASELPQFVDEVLSCEKIIASSLHGLIFAHAYGVPAKWVEFSDKVPGKGLKFRDYLMSVGFPPYDPVWPLDNHWEPVHDLQIDLDALWGARPWD